jgi:hypothetical protein
LRAARTGEDAGGVAKALLGRPPADPLGRTARLIGDLGCRPLDFGDLARAGQLEALAAVGIRLVVRGLDLHSVMPPDQPGPPPGA